MNNKLIISILLAVLGTSNVLSQDRNGIVLDTAIIRCWYKASFVADTLHPEDIEENVMLLQIGTHTSKYVNVFQFFSDSIVFTEKELSVQKAKIGKTPRSKILLFLFKGYPAGKITFIDYIGLDRHLYEEDLVSPEWQLGEEAATISGYACKNARTFFRGREYEAWYTTEIPISEGPWKFTGLPGLILKISDTRNHFFWECVSLEKSKGIDEIFFVTKRTLFKITHAQFLERMQRYMDSPGAYVNGNPVAGIGTYAFPPKAYEKRPYNPIELDIK
jgi:GLPGLI family protein